MMTGIPIENSLWTAYLLTIFFVVAGFAVYDVLYRRVPDRALVFFIPLAALAPVLQGYFLLNHGLPPLFLWPVATHALVGALLGFCIPLAAALATNGTGLGGGDIKFCGILGLVYGPSGMALVFLTAAVITVWGSPGSGKSMFCCILAKALTRDKRKAIIINADMNVPMLPVWLPEQIIQTNTSIGQVLSSVEIDTSLVASHVTVLKNYPFIGMMGYAAGENPLSYPEVKYTMVLQLIHAAAKLVDFVILDCSTSMTNVFTPAAIEAGDVVIRILTPDLKGINYLKAHQPLLVDERFRFSEHMTFAGLARPFHALDEMGYIIGGFDGLLP